MASRTVLSVDLGAESGRVMAVHFDGRTLTFEELHRFPWKGQSGGVHAGTPVLLTDDRVLISSAYGAGAALLQVGEETTTLVLKNISGGTVAYKVCIKCQFC